MKSSALDALICILNLEPHIKAPLKNAIWEFVIYFIHLEFLLGFNRLYALDNVTFFKIRKAFKGHATFQSLFCFCNLLLDLAKIANFTYFLKKKFQFLRQYMRSSLLAYLPKQSPYYVRRGHEYFYE